VLGDVDYAISWYISHNDASSSGRLDVDVVIADPATGEHLAEGELVYERFVKARGIDEDGCGRGGCPGDLARIVPG
jgi:hypothetical protein